ncbi:MAG: (d)CMP kinase [Peptococcaceae bacterium]|nr:(d)CMP kinase [Peptococcaceae bacterium]
MSVKLNVAIDGPAGSGKSTVAKLVASQLGYLYIDTGAMYRALTLKALRNGLDLDDPGSLTDMTVATIVELQINDGQNLKVLLDHKDVTEAIREPVVSQKVSLIAKIPEIRKHLVGMQQEMAKQGGVVMEGRDIGTVVLPKAQVKVFLTATTEERARRRRLELAEKGHNVLQEDMQKEIEARDLIDTGREADPLIQAADAFLINCSELSAQEVAQIIVGLVDKDK